MWKTSLIQFFKIIRQNKFFTFLNLFGISVTMMIILIGTIKIENQIWPGATEVNNDNMLFMNRMMLKKEGNTKQGGMNLRMINEHVIKMKTPKEIAFSSEESWSYIGESGVEDFLIRSSNAGLWSVFDYNFLEGRPFNEVEVKEGAMVAVIDQDIKNRFFPDGKAIGELLEVSGRAYKVIGIIENVPFNCMQSKGNIFFPYTVDDVSYPDYSQTGRYIVSFLGSGNSNLQEIRDEVAKVLNMISGDLEEGWNLYFAGPDNSKELFLRGYEIGDSYAGHRASALQLLGKFLLLMLLPAINMISIQLTRIHERSEEIGVRKSFGATKTKLIRQILYENTLLTFLGAILGLIMAVVVVYGFKETLMANLFDTPGGNIRIRINAGVFWVTMFGSLILSLISGLIPAIKMSRLQPAAVLKGGDL